MAITIPVTDPDELAHALTIHLRLQQGRHIHKRFERAAATGPTPGSELALDDVATAWMNSSHVVITALSMAADNIRAVGGLLEPTDDGDLVVPMYAHYPIIRSVLEAAAEAKWLLLPDDRKERITRLLRARLTDAKQDADLAKIDRETAASLDDAPDASLLAEQEQIAKNRFARDLEKIRAIGREQGISWNDVKAGLPPWIHIIRAVCVVEATPGSIRVPGGYAAGIWKIISGLSHPSTTRSVNYSSLERTSQSNDGVFDAQVTASFRRTVEAMTVAWNTTNEAIELFERRQRL
jgi:hypothetical protein